MTTRPTTPPIPTQKRRSIGAIKLSTKCSSAGLTSRGKSSQPRRLRPAGEIQRKGVASFMQSCRAKSLSMRILAKGCWVGMLALGGSALCPAETVGQSSGALPVRGLHLSAPAKHDLSAGLEFIRTSLPKEKVNTLILEFDFNFNFESRAEFKNPSALGKEEVRQ